METINSNDLFLTPSGTMDIVLDAIREVIPYELAVILSRETGNKLKVRHFKGKLSTKKLEDYEINLPERPDLENALSDGNVKLVKEDEHNHHLDTYEGLIELPAGHSCMLAPLSLGGENIGLMTLDHSQCDIFTPQRVAIAGTLSRLISLALAQAVKTDTLLNEKETLIYERNSLLQNAGTITENLVGNSPGWKNVIEKIKLVAPTDSHVMILGETGTGKEQAAKAIHILSKRAERPFIALNCSALNSNLAESELFGHEKGAFTGAYTQRKGRFELADGGILFLDEIGDLPQEIQPKLLRAIQEGAFERVGSEKTIKADVRIICATHINLEEKIKKGEFREDLYYRLNVFPVQLPPLRERKNDIVVLAGHFLKKFETKFQRDEIKISAEALHFLENQEWPGNVRELQNSLERAIIMSRGEILMPEHFISEYQQRYSPAPPAEIILKSYDDEVKKIILRALEKSGGKIYGDDGAAKILDIKPTTLQSKMKKLGISY